MGESLGDRAREASGLGERVGVGSSRFEESGSLPKGPQIGVEKTDGRMQRTEY